ncbi:MAG: hypothetical protein RJA36_2014 [Pseudomonadota bacterium]|jgi:cholesterol transport system auxiliary component
MSPTDPTVRLCRCALGATALALLSACSVLPRPVPQDVYLLPAGPAQAHTPASPLPWSLRVMRPAASAMLAGQRILVLPEEQRVSYYKGASWNEPVPTLLRNRLLDTLRADGRISQLSGDERLLQADFELDSDLRAFQSEYRDGIPQAVIRLDVRLVRTGSQRIAASRRFEIRRPAAGTAVGDVVEALGLAADQLADELSRWTAEQLASAAARRD